ncbi:hypothetical protein [Tropicimonas isoalkanivorans]|uniref:hypothetical protein n=1 Tax=Tropicimonas isoalkanivorans TaxID=441112 RepID=UPI0011601106|nr:hypothetical protein [Tropicimonas isoalkanivorans]
MKKKIGKKHSSDRVERDKNAQQQYRSMVQRLTLGIIAPNGYSTYPKREICGPASTFRGTTFPGSVPGKAAGWWLEDVGSRQTQAGCP